MMRYVKYAVVVLLTCVILLSTLYHFYQRGYDRYYTFENARLQEIIRGTKNHDIVFLGSSRTYHHVNPKIVDSITQLDSYNAGIDGANLVEINLALETYLQHHPAPKLIVADISLLCFSINKQPFFNPNIYYEYLDDTVVYKTLKPYKKVFLLKNLPFIRFAEADDMLREKAVLGLLGKTSVDNRYHYKGFLPYGNDTLKLPLNRKYQLNYEVEKDGIALLNNLINTCKKNNSKLILTYCPEYDCNNQITNEAFFPTLNKVSSDQHIPFLNYRMEKIGNDHRLFMDEHHLNRTGADIFSTMLAHDINKVLHQAI